MPDFFFKYFFPKSNSRSFPFLQDHGPDRIDACLSRSAIPKHEPVFVVQQVVAEQCFEVLLDLLNVLIDLINPSLIDEEMNSTKIGFAAVFLV